MAGSFGPFYQRGLRQINLGKYTAGVKEDPITLPCPQAMDFEETLKVSEWPGGDAVCQTATQAESLKLKLKFGGLNLEQQAQLSGANFSAYGASGNRVQHLQRKTTQVAPNIYLDGMINYIGNDYPNGRFYLKAWWGIITGPLKWSNQTKEKADLEIEVTFTERPSDGAFYELIAMENGTDLATTADNTAPTLSSSTPADSATGVSVSANLVCNFSEAVLFQPEHFKLYKVAGVTMTPVALADSTFTYDPILYRVTINPASNLDAASDYTLQISGLMDLAGNSIADTAVDFTTA